MSTPAQVPMVNQNGQAGLVDADKVDSAKASGYEPAYKMQGPDGSIGYVGESKVPAARQQNYAVTPDNPGVQRMATPQGQLTYATPAEVDSFTSSGHVPIADNGNFQIAPLPGEDNTDTMQRASTIAKNLPPDVMQKAIQAEKKTITPGRVAGTLAAAPVIGAATTAGIAGTAEASSAAIQQIGKIPGLLKSAYDWAAANPVKAFLLYKLAEESGIGQGGVKKAIHLFSGAGE